MSGVQGNRVRTQRRAGAALALCLLAVRALHAAPFVPERDDALLEELPAISAQADGRELRAEREALARDPGNLELAAQFAWQAIRAGRRDADPRYFGQAQSAIARWWELAAPPTPVLLLRATLRQNRHEFDAALADLALLLEREPRNAQAWLTRAVIESVRGELGAARRSCAVLLSLGNRLTATTCLAQVGSLSGRAERSYALLERCALAASADAEPIGEVRATRDEELWALTTLAEIAARRGLRDRAERWFERAAAIAADDSYLLAARADFWLDAGRPEAVVAALARETRRDGLLLRLALAERRLGLASLQSHSDELRARFDAARRRGDRLHLGEEARFQLELQGDARAALRLARENWELQREPRDARALLEAALAAAEPEAAEPALAQRRASGLEDVALDALAARLEALR